MMSVAAVSRAAANRGRPATGDLGEIVARKAAAVVPKAGAGLSANAGPMESAPKGVLKGRKEIGDRKAMPVRKHGARHSRRAKFRSGNRVLRSRCRQPSARVKSGAAVVRGAIASGSAARNKSPRGSSRDPMQHRQAHYPHYP